MDEKKVLIIILSPPFRNLNCYESLRAAIGLINHDVKIVWTQNGVFNVLKATKNPMLGPLVRLASDMDIELYVFEKDLEQRKIGVEELLENIKPISQDELLEKIASSDIIMTF